MQSLGYSKSWIELIFSSCNQRLNDSELIQAIQSLDCTEFEYSKIRTDDVQVNLPSSVLNTTPLASDAIKIRIHFLFVVASAIVKALTIVERCSISLRCTFQRYASRSWDLISSYSKRCRIHFLSG